MASFLLFYIYKAFEPSPDSDNDVVTGLLASIFILFCFYLPVRIQDSFLSPSGAELRSFIQTAVALTLFHCGIGFIPTSS